MKPILSQRFALLAGSGQQRIPPQLFMIVEVFIAQGHGVETLSNQLLQPVIHKAGVPPIVKTVRQRHAQPQVAIHLARQQRAAVAGEGAPGKIGHHLAPIQVLKQHRLPITVCPRRSGQKFVHLTRLSESSDALAASLFNFSVKYPG